MNRAAQQRTALAGVLRFGIKATALGQEAGETLSLTAANQFLRSTIAPAKPLFRLPKGGERLPGTPAPRPVPVFDGKPTSLTFAANLPGRTTVAGLHVVTLRFVPGDDDTGDGALMAQIKLDRASAVTEPSDPDAGGTSQPLIRQTARVTFRYFGAKGRDAPRNWHVDWQGLDALPELIEMVIGFADRDRRRWPETVVRLRLR